MNINLIWDSSVANAPAGFEAAIEYAAQYLDSVIADNITVNIRVGWGETDNGVYSIPSTATANGTFFSSINLTYSQLKTDLAAAYALSGSPADLTALANLPATDPTNGGLYTLSYAQEKAWGLIPANGTELDGAIGFSTAFTWAVNPSDRAVSGDIDLIGVAEHELTHALGRIIYLPGAGDPTYTAMDLFRFASVGNLQLTYAQPSYFSVNGGRSGQDHPLT